MAETTKRFSSRPYVQQFLNPPAELKSNASFKRRQQRRTGGGHTQPLAPPTCAWKPGGRRAAPAAWLQATPQGSAGPPARGGPTHPSPWRRGPSAVSRRGRWGAVRSTAAPLCHPGPPRRAPPSGWPPGRRRGWRARRPPCRPGRPWRAAAGSALPEGRERRVRGGFAPLTPRRQARQLGHRPGPARPGDGSRPFPPSLPLTEDLPPVLLAPHAAAQLTQPHAGFQLERGRLPEGAGALRHGGTGPPPPPPPPPPPTAGRSPRRHRRAGPMAGRQEGEARGGGRGRPRPSAASLLSLRYFGAGTARRCPPGVQRFGRRKNFAFRRAPSARCRPPAPSAAAGWPCRSSRVSAAGGRPLLRASGPWCEEPGRTKRNEVLKLGFANKPSFPVSGFGLAFLSTRPAGYAWVRAHPVLPKTWTTCFGSSCLSAVEPTSARIHFYLKKTAQRLENLRPARAC